MEESIGDVCFWAGSRHQENNSAESRLQSVCKPIAGGTLCRVWQKGRALPNSLKNNGLAGGEGGIRTHGTVTRTTVFETVPFDHSGTSP
jgi:hypothetical protein